MYGWHVLHLANGVSLGIRTMYGWHVLRSRLAYELAGMLCVSVLQMVEIGTRRVFQNTQDCTSAAAKAAQLLTCPALLIKAVL